MPRQSSPPAGGKVEDGDGAPDRGKPGARRRPDRASAESRLAPIGQSGRIVELDILRGVALLGILSMNIVAFSMPGVAYLDPTAYGDLSGANFLVWTLTHLFAAEKFMTVFSMLFGAGILLMAERAAASGRNPAGPHILRMLWLIVFGLLHAHLLWYGDILFWYGLCGLVVFWLRGLKPVALIGLGIVSIGVASAFMLFGGLTIDHWPPETYNEVMAQLNPSAEAVAQEIAAYRGGWLGQMEHRVPTALDLEISGFLSWAFWRASGVMLLGMALFKLGILTGERSRRLYRGLVLAAVFVGLPIIAWGIHRNFATGWEPSRSFFFGEQYNYWASLIVALGWIGVVIPACRMRTGDRGSQTGRAAAALLRLRRSLAAVGRMAFTNYILQTVLCTWIFYGHGLGLFGQVERVDQIAIVVAVWALQLAVSPLWLKRFRFGPLEWLWRALTYGRAPPMRRLKG